MTDDEVIKRRRVPPRPAGSAKKPEKRVGADVSPGDLIEYGLTYQVNIERQLSVWLKTGVTSSVHAGESSEDAWKRVKKFVDAKMAELIEEHQK